MKQQRYWTIQDTIRTVFVIVGSCGIAEIFLTGLPLQAEVGRTILCASFCAFINVLCIYMSRYYNKMKYVPVLCIVISGVVCKEKLFCGLRTVYGICMMTFAANSGWNIAPATDAIYENNAQDIQIWISLVWVLAIYSYLLVCILFYCTRVWAAALAILPIYIVFIVFNTIPDVLAFGCALFVLFGMMAFAHRNTMMPFVWISSATILVLCLVGFFVPQSDYHKPMFFRKVNAILASQFDGWFHSDLRDEPEVDYALGGLHRGKLGQFSEVLYQEQDLFRLTTADLGHGQYLPFFIGDVYQNNQWYTQTEAQSDDICDVLAETFDQSAAEQSRLAQSSQQYYENVFSYYQEITEIATSDLTLFSQSVKKTLKDKGIWRKKQTEITGIPYKDMDDFSYTAGNIQINTTGTENQKKGSYTSYVRTCAERAQNIDLQVPESVRQVIERLLGSHSCRSVQERIDYAEYVKNYLNNHYTYSRNPGKVPDSEEFVSYFLTVRPQGYCTYFATSAVMMLRCAGIPARYVEGYYVSEDEIRAGERSLGMIIRQDGNGNERVFYYGAYTLSVPDHAAHAWVEYYLPGYGWKQLEVTPGSGESIDASVSERPVFEGDSEDSVHPFDDVQGRAWNESSQEAVTASVQEEAAQAETEAATADLQTEYAATDIALEMQTTNETKMNSQNRILYTRTIKMIGVIFAGVMILSAICVYRYQTFQKAYGKHQHEADISYLYRALEDVLRITGYAKDTQMDYLEYASYLEQVNPICHQFQMREVMEVVLEERFGQNRISEEIRQQTAQRLHQMRQQLLRMQPRWKRVYNIYIRRM